MSAKSDSKIFICLRRRNETFKVDSTLKHLSLQKRKLKQGSLKEINAIKTVYRVGRSDFVSSRKNCQFSGNETTPSNGNSFGINSRKLECSGGRWSEILKTGETWVFKWGICAFSNGFVSVITPASTQRFSAYCRLRHRPVKVYWCVINLLINIIS